MVGCYPRSSSLVPPTMREAAEGRGGGGKGRGAWGGEVEVQGTGIKWRAGGRGEEWTPFTLFGQELGCWWTGGCWWTLSLLLDFGLLLDLRMVMEVEC